MMYTPRLRWRSDSHATSTEKQQATAYGGTVKSYAGLCVSLGSARPAAAAAGGPYLCLICGPPERSQDCWLVVFLLVFGYRCLTGG